MDWEGIKKDTKDRRNRNIENFHNLKFEKLKEILGNENCNYVSTGKYTFNTEKYGTIDFFPASNKLLIRKNNKWIDSGHNILNNLLKGDK